VHSVHLVNNAQSGAYSGFQFDEQVIGNLTSGGDSTQNEPTEAHRPLITKIVQRGGLSAAGSLYCTDREPILI